MYLDLNHPKHGSMEYIAIHSLIMVCLNCADV